jgi:hypothetical protein
LRRIADASLAVFAEASFLAFCTLTVWPQYGQVLVFVPFFASRRPPHLGQTTTRVDAMVSLIESLFHVELDNAMRKRGNSG